MDATIKRLTKQYDKDVAIRDALPVDKRAGMDRELRALKREIEQLKKHTLNGSNCPR